MYIIYVKKLEPFGYQKDIQTVRGIGYILKRTMKKGSMFQKTRIRLTILNSLVFIILIGVLGSIIYSYTYKRIYSGVNESIEKAVQHRKNADDKKLPKKIRGYPPIGDPRIMELTWLGNTVEIDIENGKRRFIFEDNLEKFSPKKLGTLQDIEVQGQYFRIFSFQKRCKNSSNCKGYNS